jgi:AraC family transcriptional regulator
MTYDIVQKELDAQPVLLVRRKVNRSQIGSAIGEALPHIFMYAQQHGIALAGHPLTRYVEVGPGLLTIEPAMRVVSRSAPEGNAAKGEVIEDVLPAGSAATTIHAGPYETLTEAYAALERWMEQNGLRPAGPPWEDYITDPAEFPDPKDWKTEVCWPIARNT